jgi:NAD(P)H dehydrogenase (quinone)
MSRIVVAWQSGYGHTKKVAEAVQAGAASVAGTEARMLDVATIDEAGWQMLAEADAIVFGAPTYMGGPSAAFKAFADASVKVWFTQGWKDKLAGGFTCSLTMSGDKYATLMSILTLAMQHGMVWNRDAALGAARAPRADEPAGQLHRRDGAGRQRAARAEPAERRPQHGMGLRTADRRLREGQEGLSARPAAPSSFDTTDPRAPASAYPKRASQRSRSSSTGSRKAGGSWCSSWRSQGYSMTVSMARGAA